jgi:YoeB-like toxin of bacterial type II toxin-antitoxin system
MSVQPARTLAGHGRGPHDRGSSSALNAVKSTRGAASGSPTAGAGGVSPGREATRITEEHRLVYLVDGEDLVILQARFRYK